MAFGLHRLHCSDIERMREDVCVVDVAVVAPIPVVDAVTADAQDARVVDHRVWRDSSRVDGA